jgi:hypothetical protein
MVLFRKPIPISAGFQLLNLGTLAIEEEEKINKTGYRKESS